MDKIQPAERATVRETINICRPLRGLTIPFLSLPRVALAKPRSTLGYMLTPASQATCFCPLRGLPLNDHFHDFEHRVNSDNNSDCGEYVPEGQLCSTGRAATAGPGHNPFAITTLHCGKLT